MDFSASLVQISLDARWLAPRRVFAATRELGKGAPWLDRVKDPLSNFKRTARVDGAPKPRRTVAENNKERRNQHAQA